jgi:hypothetical protein
MHLHLHFRVHPLTLEVVAAPLSMRLVVDTTQMVTAVAMMQRGAVVEGMVLDRDGAALSHSRTENEA